MRGRGRGGGLVIIVLLIYKTKIWNDGDEEGFNLRVSRCIIFIGLRCTLFQCRSVNFLLMFFINGIYLKPILLCFDCYIVHFWQINLS